MSEQPSGDGLDIEALANQLADAVAARLSTERDRVIDRRELARRLDVSERAASAMAARGDIPPGYLIGGVRRWNWREVLKFLEARSGRKPRKGRGRYPRPAG